MSIFPFSRGERSAARLTAEVIALVFILAGAVTGLYLKKNKKNSEDDACGVTYSKSKKALLRYPAIKSQTFKSKKEMLFDVTPEF